MGTLPLLANFKSFYYYTTLISQNTTHNEYTFENFLVSVL